MNEPLDPHDNGTTVVAGMDTTGGNTQTPPVDPEIRVSEDGNQITRGDRKYLPAEAVQSERQRRQEAERVISQLEPLMPEFNEWLTNRRSGRDASVREAQGPTPSAGGDDYTTDELKAVAHLNNYFTEDGQSLDLTRARQALDIMGRVSERRTRQIVEPVARATAADRASRNVEDAISRQYVDGAPIADRSYVTQAFGALPPELAADASVANLVQVVAAGLEYLDKRRTGKLGSSREPQYTEGSTGRFNGDGGRGLSNFAQRAAQARGLSNEEWAKREARPTASARADRDGGIVLESGVD